MQRDFEFGRRGGNLFMMAGGRPGGWSRFTLLHRDKDAALAAEEDPFPVLGGPDGRSRLLAGSSAQQSGSFAQVVAKKGIPYAPLEEDEGTSLAPEVYGRLRAMSVMSNKAAAGVEGAMTAVEDLNLAYPWAEARLVEDVVTAVEGDREMAAACLDSMAPPCAPVEPESEGDAAEDPYMKYRRDAVQATRLRQKLGRRAANAYFAGDHRTAKSLSQQARERRAVAQELNGKAAEAILRERNPPDPEGDAHLWGLDLHGLHASEAVQAVQHRLAQIERIIAQHPVAGFSAAPTSAAAATDASGPIYLAAKVPSQRHLKVITGVGSHSRGGASIPSAVKKYLLVNEYRFTEPWAGVLAVHPKRLCTTHPLGHGGVTLDSQWQQ